MNNRRFLVFLGLFACLIWLTTLSARADLWVSSGINPGYAAIGSSHNVTLSAPAPDDPDLGEEWEKCGPYFDWSWAPPENLTVSPTSPQNGVGSSMTVSGSSNTPGTYNLAVSATGYRLKRRAASTDAWTRYGDRTDSITLKFVFVTCPSTIKVLLNGAYPPGMHNPNTGQFGNSWAHQLALDVGAHELDYNQQSDAFVYIMEQLDTDKDHVISQAEATAKQIYLIGYSWGATNCIKMNWDLHNAQWNGLIDTHGYDIDVDIPVAKLVTLDPVFAGNFPPQVESNVLTFINYRESKGGDGWMWIMPRDPNMPPHSEKMGSPFSALLHGENIGWIAEGVCVAQINVTVDKTNEVRPSSGTQDEYYSYDPDHGKYNASMTGGNVNHDTLPWYAHEDMYTELY